MAFKHSLTIPADAKPGSTIEIEVPGVIAESAMETIVQDRLTRHSQGRVKVDELDEAGWLKIGTGRGFKATKGVAEGDLGKQLETAKATWAEQELKPVLDREGSIKAELESARKERLYDAILVSAARAGVLQSLLDGPGGSKPAIVAMREHLYSFDEKTKRWYVRGQSADQPFAFGAQPTAAQPYKTVDEDMGEWSRLPTSKPFMGASTQQGPGFNAGGGKPSGAPGTVDGSDPLAIGRNLEAIATGKLIVK